MINEAAAGILQVFERIAAGCQVIWDTSDTSPFDSVQTNNNGNRICFLGDSANGVITPNRRVASVSPVTIQPMEIQELRGLFSTYRLLKKQCAQYKNRIHSLVKEKLYGYAQERIFGQSSRKPIRALEENTVLSFQINHLFDLLENLEKGVETLEDRIKEEAEPFMREIEILTGMSRPV
jgi:hypothetical protein